MSRLDATLQSSILPVMLYKRPHNWNGMFGMVGYVWSAYGRPCLAMEYHFLGMSRHVLPPAFFRASQRIRTDYIVLQAQNTGIWTQNFSACQFVSYITYYNII